MSSTYESQTKNFYIWYIIILIIWFIVSIILNVIFVYFPISRIENALIATEADAKTTLNNVDIVAKGAETIIQEVQPIAAKVQGLYCKFFPNDQICSNVTSNNLNIQGTQYKKISNPQYYTITSLS